MSPSGDYLSGLTTETQKVKAPTFQKLQYKNKYKRVCRIATKPRQPSIGKLHKIEII